MLVITLGRLKRAWMYKEARTLDKVLGLAQMLRCEVGVWELRGNQMRGGVPNILCRYPGALAR